MSISRKAFRLTSGKLEGYRKSCRRTTSTLLHSGLDSQPSVPKNTLPRYWLQRLSTEESWERWASAIRSHGLRGLRQHERTLRCSLAGHIRRPVLRDAWIWKAERQEFDPVPLRGWDRAPSEHFHKEPSERNMVNGYRPEGRQRQVDYFRTRIPSANLIVRADDLTFTVNA